MRKLLTITVLLTFILAGCAGQSEKPAVPVEKPTVSVENNEPTDPVEDTNETDVEISEGNSEGNPRATFIPQCSGAGLFDD